ncbi:MAG: solute carrier family 23 protein, partial [Myxococcota bacterium]
MADPRKQPQLIYNVDDVPPPVESLALGFQHYLIMFGATVAIPLILKDSLGIQDPAELGQLIGTMFFVSGITTLLQTTFGNRLPIVQGGTFSLLASALAICGMAELAEVGWQVRMQHIQGAIIVGAVVEMILGYTGMVGALVRFISPVIIAPTIALIGLSLVQIGAPQAGQNWYIGGLTIVLIIAFSQYLRSVHRVFQLFPVVMAIAIAWAVAGICTYAGLFPEGHPAHVSTAAVADAPWISVPYPFQWGMPVFGVAAIVGMLAGYIASIVESLGD